ncbi:dUTPase [Staphylococcus nepalensis]|uniref:dUTPase n=1 Tax=Staphylococcus nepalensis TaxID=214473 RepID=UPI0011C8CC2C|nr:dUTPase [Staphylococcus nepalensis]
MTNTITVDQLKELLQIQKDFDDRIPTKNPKDTHKAYVVEFFEWYNTIEPFKNWKQNKGKAREQQLDELSDMMAFALSAWLMEADEIGKVQPTIPDDSELYHEVGDMLDMAKRRDAANEFYKNNGVERRYTFDKYEIENVMERLRFVSIKYVFRIAMEYYSLSELITAYKKKMERNHARQDGTADKDKGYI